MYSRAKIYRKSIPENKQSFNQLIKEIYENKLFTEESYTKKETKRNKSMTIVSNQPDIYKPNCSIIFLFRSSMNVQIS